tara:strand:+ start:267 stop:482 length:216 start_codon:yes stop_codon:yes gene_type:complete
VFAIVDKDEFSTEGSGVGELWTALGSLVRLVWNILPHRAMRLGGYRDFVGYKHWQSGWFPRLKKNAAPLLV